MCHQSPTVSVFATMIALWSVVAFVLHIWQVDRCRVLLFSKKDAFRFVMTWMMAMVCIGFFVFTVTECYIKYRQGYVAVPSVGIVPTPYQFWPKEDVQLFKASYYVLTVSWGCLISLHLEEVLYWGYMLRACQTSGSSHWFRSIWFKLWAIGTITGFGVIAGSVSISDDLQKIETHLFFSGSIISVFLVAGSAWMCYKFPRFIVQARRLGANQDVLGRLLYIKVLNNLRTGFRVVYSTCLLTLSADGMSHSKKINMSEFALDALLVAGYFSVFASTVLSLWVLLPRKAPQSQEKYGQTSAPLIGAPNPLADDLGTATAWSVLGERLNIERDQLTDVNPNSAIGSVKDLDGVSTKAKTSLLSPRFGTKASRASDRSLRDSAPFPIRQEYIDDVEMGQMNLPQVLKEFGGPLDVRTSNPRDLRVIITNEVVHDAA